MGSSTTGSGLTGMDGTFGPSGMSGSTTASGPTGMDGPFAGPSGMSGSSTASGLMAHLQASQA